jgi:hypothetical protein
MEEHMSDPRYTDPVNDPRRAGAGEPAGPRYDLQDDGGRGTMWAWIIGIVAIIVVAMVVYDYNRPISTVANPPSANSPSTTGAALPPVPKAVPSSPGPGPATPVPAAPAPVMPAPVSPDTPH